MIAVFTCENVHTKVTESCFITGYCKQISMNVFAFKTVDLFYTRVSLLYMRNENPHIKHYNADDAINFVLAWTWTLQLFNRKSVL